MHNGLPISKQQIYYCETIENDTRMRVSTSMKRTLHSYARLNQKMEQEMDILRKMMILPSGTVEATLALVYNPLILEMVLERCINCLHECMLKSKEVEEDLVAHLHRHPNSKLPNTAVHGLLASMSNTEQRVSMRALALHSELFKLWVQIGHRSMGIADIVKSLGEIIHKFDIPISSM